MSDQWTDQLSAYLDGELDPIVAAQVEAHLAACRECQAVLIDLRLIVAAAPAYRGTEPGRDSWPAIRAAIEADRMVTFPATARPAPGFRWRHLVAAGLVMAAAGLAGGWYWFGGQREVVQQAAVSQPGAGALAGGLTSAAYDSAVAELQRVLATNRGRLDTATVRSVEQSLALIDRAIGEARAAIQRDTANEYLNGQIAANLKKKLSVLRLATRAMDSET